MKKQRQSVNRKATPPKTTGKTPVTVQPQNVPEPVVSRDAEKPSRLVPKWLLLQVAALVCVVAVGLWVRLEDLAKWEREPGKAFYNGQPLLTALDGLFYLTLARDIVEGTYFPIDEKRAVPDYPPRPQPPPLISALTAGVARVFPVSLNWVAVLLPALLGVLIFLPLYGLGRFFGGPLMGTVAALMGVLFPYYVYRSGLGWLDTDCLNVTLSTAVAYFFLKFGVTAGPGRYAYFSGGMVCYALFLWWWDQTPHVVTAISLAPLAVAIVFFYRPPSRERWIFFGVLSLGLMVLILWKGTLLFTQFVNILYSQFSYISKESVGPFPNIGVSISEQVRPSFDTMISLSSGNFIVFTVALCGLVWLIWRQWKETLFLSVLFFLSALAFFYARRFAIFCVPMAALGVASFVNAIWALRSRIAILKYLTPVVVFFLAWMLFGINRTQAYWPKERPTVVSGLVQTGKMTPQDAVIWAWWDHGYTIPYWAKRASVNDGSVHSGERTVFNGLPLATHSERLAANFMHFWVARGMAGMGKVYQAMGNDQGKAYAFVKEILSAGPQRASTLLNDALLPPAPGLETTEAWLEFFFPSNPRPVYLFVDDLLTRTSYWWFWFGSWDIQKQDGIHADYRIVTDMVEENGRLKARDGTDIDMRTGSARIGGSVIPLQELAVWDGEKSQTRQFSSQSGAVFEFSVPNRLGALMHREMAPSVFNKLFLRQSFSREYFNPVISGAPWYQLWEVRGDSWKAGSQNRTK